MPRVAVLSAPPPVVVQMTCRSSTSELSSRLLSRRLLSSRLLSRRLLSNRLLSSRLLSKRLLSSRLLDGCPSRVNEPVRLVGLETSGGLTLISWGGSVDVLPT